MPIRYTALKSFYSFLFFHNIFKNPPPFHEGALLASGPNAASIHAYASDKKIREGEMVVVDLGARYKGYYSDMTITIPIGKLNKDERKVLEFVKNLKSETIEHIMAILKSFGG